MKGPIWINLPSKDLVRVRKFFTHLGFAIDQENSSEHLIGMSVGDNKLIVNYFHYKYFESLSGAHPATDTMKSHEVLFSLGAESIEDVDNMTLKVLEAGGRIFSRPAFKEGWMYGFGFLDPDGHRWNVVYMDMENRPK